MTRAAKIPPPPPSLTLTCCVTQSVRGTDGKALLRMIESDWKEIRIHSTFPFGFLWNQRLNQFKRAPYICAIHVNICSQMAQKPSHFCELQQERETDRVKFQTFLGWNVMGRCLHIAASFTAWFILGRNFISLLAVKTLVVHFRVFSSGHFIVGRETRRFVPLANGTMHLRRLWQLRSVTLKRFLQNA